MADRSQPTLPATLRISRAARVLAKAKQLDTAAWQTPLLTRYAKRRGDSVVAAAAVVDLHNPEIAAWLAEDMYNE